MIVKANVSVNYLNGLGKSSGLVPVNTLCFEDGKNFRPLHCHKNFLSLT